MNDLSSPESPEWHQKLNVTNLNPPQPPIVPQTLPAGPIELGERLGEAIGVHLGGKVEGRCWAEALENDDWARTLHELLRHEPVLPLAEVVARLEGEFDNISNHTQTVLPKAQEIVERDPSIWLDGAAMICLYTAPAGRNEISFYSKMQQILFNRDRSMAQLRRWMPAIKLLDEALTRLPAPYRVPPSTQLYREVQWRYPTLQAPNVGQYFGVGTQRFAFVFNSFTTNGNIWSRCSATTSPSSSLCTLHIVKIQEGFDVRVFSANPQEEEVLARPLSLFRVVSFTDGGPAGSFDVVESEEVPRPP